MAIATQERKKKKRTLGEWYEEVGSTYVFVLPTFIMFIALTLYPMIWVYRNMFYEYDGISKASFVGMDNFIRVFTIVSY